MRIGGRRVEDIEWEVEVEVRSKEKEERRRERRQMRRGPEARV